MTPIERLRQRLAQKLDYLECGLAKVRREQPADAEWAQPVYERHINRCRYWLKSIEKLV